MKSVNASRFAMVPRHDIPRSVFETVHTHKTTFDSGFLIPVLVHEVLPGDSVKLRMNAFCRLTTPLVPIMDNIVLESFFFYCPLRLLWDNFERFMGDKATIAATTEYLVPQVSLSSAQGWFAVGSIADYFGITLNNAVGSIDVSALPFRMYNRVYNEWFRDPDLQDPIYSPTDDGPDTPLTNYQIRRRGKRQDYFTAARPWPQKPANVTGVGSTAMWPLGPGGNFTFPSEVGAPVSGIGTGGAAATAGGTRNTSGGRQVVFGDEFVTGANVALEAGRTLGGVATAFPNVRVMMGDIRTANMIQIMLERNARGGTRYVEILRSEFGVMPPDFRLQRPEYLGGGRSFVQINPVAQTSASGVAGTTTVLGELAGIGTAVVNNHGFTQSFVEHGLILGLVQVRADITYQQGVERMWFRRSRFDYYTPTLAHLGEQAIISREIYADGSGNNTGQEETVTGDFSVFGYIPRWEEYRYKPSRISGRFRSTATSTLDVWHLAQEFSARPVLNAAFIEDNPPVDRVLQVGGADYEEFYFDSQFDIRMARPMPMFSIPHLGPRL